jgi:hypothetical protein
VHALGVVHSVRKVKYLRELENVEAFWLMIYVCV